MSRRLDQPPELVRQRPAPEDEPASLASDQVLDRALRHAEQDALGGDRTQSERIAAVFALLQEAERGLTRPQNHIYLPSLALILGIAGVLVATGLAATRSWIAVPVGVGSLTALIVLVQAQIRDSQAARFGRMREALRCAIDETGASDVEIAEAVQRSSRQKMRIARPMRRVAQLGLFDG